MFKLSGSVLAVIMLLAAISFAQTGPGKTAPAAAAAKAPVAGQTAAPPTTYNRPQERDWLVAVIDSVLERINAGTGSMTINVAYSGKNVVCNSPVHFSRTYEIADRGEKQITQFFGKYGLKVSSIGEGNLTVSYLPEPKADSSWTEPIIRFPGPSISPPQGAGKRLAKK